MLWGRSPGAQRGATLWPVRGERGQREGNEGENTQTRDRAGGHRRTQMLPLPTHPETRWNPLLLYRGSGRRPWAHFIYWSVAGLQCCVSFRCAAEWFSWGHICWGQGFPGGSDGKESTCNAADMCLIPGSGRLPGGGNGSPLQYSCLENPMDRRAWLAAVHRAAKSWTRLKRLSMHASVNPTPNLSLPSPFPLVTISLLSMSMSLFLFCI